MLPCVARNGSTPSHKVWHEGTTLNESRQSMTKSSSIYVGTNVTRTRSFLGTAKQMPVVKKTRAEVRPTGRLHMAYLHS